MEVQESKTEKKNTIIKKKNEWRTNMFAFMLFHKASIKDSLGKAFLR